jgi:hypothetical protein
MIDQSSLPGVRLTDNPLLCRELNGVAPSRKYRDARRFFWIVTGIIVLATVTLCYLIGIGGCRSPYRSSGGCSILDTVDAGLSRSVFLPALAGSLLIGLLLDFYFISLPGGRLAREKENGHWDAIRVTTLTTAQIIGMKYVGAQLRAWRAVSVEVALRIAVVAILVFDVILLQLGGYALLDNSNLFGSLGTFVIVGSVYILEPIWRMRMVVSMGLAISMQVHSLSFAALANFGALLAMRILQGILIAGFALLVSSSFLSPRYGAQAETNLMAVLTFGFFGLCIYLFYFTGRSWMLSRAMRLAEPV